MKSPKKTVYILISCLVFFFGCKRTVELNNNAESLKKTFDGMFLVGTALNSRHINSSDSLINSIIETQFNAFTSENAMKWENIHPLPDSFNFTDADNFVEFCEKKGGFTIGHVLVWHQQTPDWVFKDSLNNLVSRDTLLNRMKKHITTVVSHFKGRIKGWDVVNEAINDDGSMRENLWYKIIGDDYVEKAFEYAYEADSGAELYYNDYSLPTLSKRNGVITLINSLKNKGIKIDGIGMQGHYHMDYPNLGDLEKSVIQLSNTGVNVMITELEITVLPIPDDFSGADISVNYKYNDSLNPYPHELPDNMQKKLADRYADLFSVFVKNSDKISRVTLWGISDGDSWRNYWPIPGRKDYPLLYDRNLSPKPAFNAVINCAKKK